MLRNRYEQHYHIASTIASHQREVYYNDSEDSKKVKKESTILRVFVYIPVFHFVNTNLICI